MEVWNEMISTLWEALDTAIIPVIDISVKKFLLGYLILTCLVDLLNFFLGKALSPVSKTTSEGGVDNSYAKNVDWRAVHSARNRAKYNF